MTRNIALGLLALSGCALAGCVTQTTYDNAARNECRKSIDADERRACLNGVEQNSYERRAENRRLQ